MGFGRMTRPKPSMRMRSKAGAWCTRSVSGQGPQALRAQKHTTKLCVSSSLEPGRGSDLFRSLTRRKTFSTRDIGFDRRNFTNGRNLCLLAVAIRHRDEAAAGISWVTAPCPSSSSTTTASRISASTACDELVRFTTARSPTESLASERSERLAMQSKLLLH